MSEGSSPRVLVVGDPYFDIDAFALGLSPLSGRVEFDYLQVTATQAVTPRTESEARLREYAGDPHTVADALVGHHMLVVHGAPVADEALATPGLRLVCCARGGPVNVDIASATARGVPVCSSPGKNAAAVAELTIGFVLLLIRGVLSSARQMAAGQAGGGSAFDGREFFGFEAAGSTLGLVGYGHIGRQVARRAAALGMTVIAHDPFATVDDGGSARLLPLDDVLAAADVVSLHARATAGSAPLMNAAAFAAMREGSYFINSAREQLVDEAALRAALTSGHIAGAALDVIELSGERNALLDMPQVLVTPHIGGATRETLARGAQMAVQSITALLDGEPLPYLVNPAAITNESVGSTP